VLEAAYVDGPKSILIQQAAGIRNCILARPANVTSFLAADDFFNDIGAFASVRVSW
jgi:hypothetical protein